MTVAASPFPGARGFSLIEVLVAFTITTVLLGVFFQILARGAKSGVAEDRFTRATLLAEAKLAEVGTIVALSNSDTNGTTEDGLAWQRTIRPTPAATVPIRDPATVATVDAPVLFDVDVTVRPIDGRSTGVSLHSRRLGTLSASIAP